ncbi:MAG: CBS domain-containing protein [Deltaproteobacteria bacterium]|nr:CBS domain-containing protein [Deltaproteobacteria bacterium]MBW2360594.1 CBS domain-containing protein [Deltaproteobacteria bacterium]
MTKTRIPTARDVMTRRVNTIPVTADLDAAVRMLLEHGHAGAPVVDSNGAPQGVLSEHDCIRVLVQAIADGWPPGRAADHMTSEIETVSPTDDVLSLATRFAEGKHRCLLVVEQGQLVGLISRHDLLRALESLEKHTAGGRQPTTYEVMEKRHRDLD